MAEPDVSHPPTESTPAASASSAGAAKSKAPRPQKYLPTDRLNFQKQLDLLRSYGVLYDMKSTAVTPADAGVPVRLKESSAVLSNAFFQDIGLLVKATGGAFIPADAVVAYARAYTWDEATASHKLRPVMEETWFCQALIPHLRMGAKEEGQAITLLAEACAATPDYRPQLRLLLDFLQAAGLIERDGNLVRVARQGQGKTEEDERLPPPPPNLRTNGRDENPLTQDPQVMRFSVSIDINLAEVSRWSPDRITAFFGGVAQIMAAKSGLEKGGAGE